MKNYGMMFLMLCLSLPMMGQLVTNENHKLSKKERIERYESLKVAHLTKELELTPEQAQEFWPVYNKYDEKKRAIREEMKGGDLFEMSEEEAQAYLDRSHERRQEAVDLDRQMMEELEGILTSLQRVKLLKAENKFHRTLVKRFAKRHKGMKKKQGNLID